MATQQSRSQSKRELSRIDYLLQTMPLVIFETDDKGILTFSEGHGFNPHGANLSELKGFSLVESFAQSPDLVSAINTSLSGAPAQCICQVAGRWYHVFMKPIEQSKSSWRLFGTAMDVTDQKNLESRLQNSESILAATYESIVDGILVVGSEGKIISYNQRFLDMWHIPREVMSLEQDGAALAFATNQLKRPESFIKQIQFLYEKPEMESFDLLEFADGRIFERYSRPQKIKDQIVGRIWSFRDISSQRKVEEDLITSASSRMEFISNMSHEIRTPLNSIIGYAELLNVNANSPAKDRLSWSQKITSNGLHLMEIVNDILDFSKIESGNCTLNLEAFKLGQLVESLRDTLISKSLQKKLELSFHCDRSVPAMIRSDFTKLRQILLNLIDNAIKFTEQGRVSVMIHASLARNPSRVKLTFLVEDTGIGLSTNQSMKIFDPFVQADHSYRRSYGGTGLGLPIARKLAQALGGNVNLLRTRPQYGTCFEVEIEAEIFSEGAGETIKTSPLGSLEQKIDQKILQGLKILAIDDSDDNRALLREILQLAGAKVDEAADGYSGLEKAQTVAFDLILMDLQMPRIDGYKTADALRKSGFSNPIVALTAHAFTEDRERILSSGFDGHIAKPFASDKLIDVIFGLRPPTH